MSLKKVDQVNLSKYLGIWYEIASFPSWFQKGCTNTTAEYKMEQDHVQVKNSCDVNEKRKTRLAKAFTTDVDNILKVQFYPLIKADYVIEFVDEKYNHAIVGSNNKKYLWILSRKKTINEDVYEELIDIAKKKGYDVSRLEKH